MANTAKIETVLVKISDLIPSEYNPRHWSKDQTGQLKESIKRFGIVDPVIANIADNRRNIVIGGHFRLEVAKKLGYTEIPVVYLNIPEIEREKELNLRLNKNRGEFDYDLLAKFDENLLKDIGFNSEEMDDIFEIDTSSEIFDLEKELKKLKIDEIIFKKGDVYALGDSRLMCGDSTIETDVIKLMNGEKASMCCTDPPYILDYLNGKQRHGNPTVGFGAKKNRRYLETDVLPDNFTELWMANIAKVQDENFSIIVYENWKNIRTIWGEMEKYWRVKNMLVWHLPNRNQGYSVVIDGTNLKYIFRQQ